MTRRKSPSDSPLSSGIDHAVILADRTRGSQAQRYTCGCGGRVIRATVSDLSEKFWCEKCHDVVVLLLRQKDREPPRYYTDKPDADPYERPLGSNQ